MLREELPDERLADVAEIGSWWTRTHDIAVDIVGIDHPDRPQRVTAIGTIRWRDRRPLGRDDPAPLHNQRVRVPGADDPTRMIGVSQTGTSTAAFDATFSADDLLAAYGQAGG